LLNRKSALQNSITAAIGAIFPSSPLRKNDYLVGLLNYLQTSAYFKSYPNYFENYKKPIKI